MKKTILLFACAALFMTACVNTENEDVVEKPSHDGAIETTVSITHAGKHDILTTTHMIWVKNLLQKRVVTTDTLDNLGTAAQVAEDSDGNEKVVTVPKEYEFYITVK